MAAVDEALRHIIDDLDRYSMATTNLREELMRLEQWNADDRARLLSGVSIEESMEVVDSASRSRNLTKLLDEFEQARRELRASVTAAMVRRSDGPGGDRTATPGAVRQS